MKFCIRKTEMAELMQKDVITATTEALQQYDTEKDICAYLKKVFDKKYGPTWHCVVGHHYGSFITHDSGDFIYMDIGNVGLLLFRCG
ncbi:Dynein light chain 1, cytoplasmic [Clonorchis sinensis]|uniref:Dynein light chain n=1 Tax=Clonorchis sinensis TaxID=79923 RepID=A0A3R7D2W3_CLOSI|nr:Dynein light chain 1, cytoplasmic [Clonorchis sinensis]